MKKRLLLFAAVVFCALSTSAQKLSLPTVIGSGMVLQQNENINIWGWAEPSAKVTVDAMWLEAPVKTKADADGKWIVSLATPAGSYEPMSMTVASGKEKIRLDDILIGEVWLCSGQSNMAWKTELVLDLKEEMENAAEVGRYVRLYNTGRISSEEPQDDVPEAAWSRCSPESVAKFSGVGYGFGLELQRGLDVPVGLLQAAYGGTFLEGWVSEDAILNGEKSDRFAKSVKVIDKRKSSWSGKESHLYNANIHPLLNVRIAGVIWYQGCANVPTNPVSYRETLAGLINSWRREFNNPAMPFYIAQIAPHTYKDLQGALLRESQAYVADNMSDCELVVTNDSQEIPGDIHPRLKKNVSHRFAMCALGQHYGKNVGEWRSPAFDKMTVEGSYVTAHFKNLPTALTAKGDKVIGFQIAEKGADGSLTYHLADARISDSGTSVILSSENVDNPSEVRYCFDESVGNLFSAEGLPLAPFRTDRRNKPLAESARAYIEPASETPIVFEGEGYEKVRFEAGTGLWIGSELKLFEGSYPEEFEGFEAMISNVVAKGEKSSGGKIIAKEDGRIYFLARTDKPTRKTWYKGWRMIIPAEVEVMRPQSDGTVKTVGGLFVHYMDVRKGDEIMLHESESWSGVIPIASSIEYTE